MKSFLSALLIATASVGKSAAFVGPAANTGLGVRSIHRSNDIAHAPGTIDGLPSSGTLRIDSRHSNLVVSKARAAKLSALQMINPLKLIVKNDLIFGYFVLYCAVFPYLLQIPFPKFANKFFLPVYNTTINDGLDARKAEIGWKTRYSVLAFSLTTLNAIEVLTVSNVTPQKILRDSYALWVVFYINAIFKLRREAKSGLVPPGIRYSSQLWHIIVVLGLSINLLAKPGNICYEIISFFLKKIGLA